MTGSLEKAYEEVRSLSSELFLYKVRHTECFMFIQSLMREYKMDRCRPNAITLFHRLVRFIKKTDNKDLIDEFNKCLVKELFIPKTEDLKEKCKQLLSKQENAGVIMQQVSSYFPKRIERPDRAERQERPERIETHQQTEALTEQSFLARLQNHPHADTVIRITELYLKCVITVGELKTLLQPHIDRSLLHYFMDMAHEIEASRRKGTNFVPLNELPEASFAQRMGVSYVEMPACYANKCDDHLLPESLKSVLNNKWVSVPLGSEHVSFSIMRKNCFEDELFKNEDEKYELDHTVIMLRRSVEHLQKIERTGKFEANALLRKILYQVYGSYEPYNLIERKPHTVSILRPRIEQKLKSLERCRQKATRSWEDLMGKNFHKSLDHRSFYFRKNDKKYNCTSRWDKELEFRQALYGIGTMDQPEIKEGKQRYNDQIDMTVDSFEHVTRQKCALSKHVSLDFPRVNCEFPAPPANRVLFVMQFSDLTLLREICSVLAPYITKKNLLQYLMLKLFGLNVKKALEPVRNLKALNLLRSLDSLKPEEATDDYDLMLDKRRKTMLDQNQEFEDLIEEDVPTINLKDVPSPFEGPAGQSFFGTRTHYHFVRYLLTIYQRFLKARELSTGGSDDKNSTVNYTSVEKYDLFRSILSNKLKDPKLEEYLRKVFCKNAYIFLSMDKLILNVAKLINTSDELSANIIKEDTKDFEHEIRPLEMFRPRSDYHQLLRLYHQNTLQFRFCYAGDILYVSAWSSAYKDWLSKETAALCDQRYQQMLAQTTVVVEHRPSKKKELKATASCEYLTQPNSLLLQPTGEESIVRRARPHTKEILSVELQRRKKIKLW